MEEKDDRVWSIGQLARATGVTVRTLHHYDDLGLLVPRRRSGSNYREYRAAEVRRLHQILSLREIGLGLDEIGEWLADPRHTPLEAVERHLERLRRVEREAVELRQRVERIAGQMRTGAEVSTQEFLETMEMMTMFEKYYTREQLDQLAQRREEVGEARIREVEAEWPKLMEEVRVEMEKGTDPSHPRVQELARRWQGLINEFTGGDPGIKRSLGKLYASEDEVAGMQTGPMREMGEYIARAAASGD